MGAGQTLSGMLEAREVDAVLIHQAPACFTAGLPQIKRMFADYKSAEIDYFRKTGIHPIMHCVVMRKDVYENAPWALGTLYSALQRARRRVLDTLADTKALAVMLPLLPAYMAETRELFGEDFWPYGLEANRKTLETLARYACEQGITRRELALEELFTEKLSG